MRLSPVLQLLTLITLMFLEQHMSLLSILTNITNTLSAIHWPPLFPWAVLGGSFVLVPNYLIYPSVHFNRSRLSRICPSCPGRTPLFTPRCSRRSVSLSLSPSLLAPLQVKSPFRSWSCGSSTWTRPQGEAFTSTASPRRGRGNPLDVPADAAPTR